MASLSEKELKRIIKGGEAGTVELKLNPPRAVDLAERFCGMANARGGLVIIGVEDSTRKIVGVADERMGEAVDVILRAARQVIKPELVLNPPEPEVYVLADKKLVVATIVASTFPKSGDLGKEAGHSLAFFRPSWPDLRLFTITAD